jgi:predicted KAP-like P-loop ATPase
VEISVEVDTSVEVGFEGISVEVEEIDVVNDDVDEDKSKLEVDVFSIVELVEVLSNVELVEVLSKIVEVLSDVVELDNVVLVEETVVVDVVGIFVGGV